MLEQEIDLNYELLRQWIRKEQGDLFEKIGLFRKILFQDSGKCEK